MLLAQIIIYLDESGDLGFVTRKGSRHFVVAALAVKEPLQLRKLVIRARKRRPRKARCSELSFHNESENVRMDLLEGLARQECWISWEAIDKSLLYDRKGRWQDTYNDLCADILSELVLRLEPKAVRIIVDKFYGKSSQRQQMDEQIRQRILNQNSPTKGNIRISHESSMSVPGLQVCDFVAGSIFQNLERSKEDHYDLIRGHVIFSRIEKECRPWGGV